VAAQVSAAKSLEGCMASIGPFNAAVEEAEAKMAALEADGAYLSGSLCTQIVNTCADGTQAWSVFERNFMLSCIDIYVYHRS
jgi:hypothetical protein